MLYTWAEEHQSLDGSAKRVRFSAKRLPTQRVGRRLRRRFMTATKIPVSQRPDVVIRPLAIDSAVITTYLLRLDNSTLLASLERFIVRLRDSAGG